MTLDKTADAPEYLAARHVLLDALEALRPHERALILAGAQAVYLQTGPGSLPIAEFTTDGDLTIDPELLSEAPPLGELMQGAGFELTNPRGAPEPGIWQKTVVVEGREISVPVDLIVPVDVAPPGGSRGARLRGHDRRAARKTRGLEAVLVDNEVMPIEALEPDDRRSARLRVAGVAALLVAKTHKIVDRIEDERDDRLNDKDGADVLRLMGASSPTAVAATLVQLTNNPISRAATNFAVEHFEGLFGRRGGAGISLASRSLREAVPEDRVRATSLAYTQQLYAALQDHKGPCGTAPPPDSAADRRRREDAGMPQPRRQKRTERGDYGWVISFGCKTTGTLRRLKVDTDPAADTSPVEVPCPCGETHRVTVSPYRRRRSADEAFDVEVKSLDELRPSASDD